MDNVPMRRQFKAWMEIFMGQLTEEERVMAWYTRSPLLERSRRYTSSISRTGCSPLPPWFRARMATSMEPRRREVITAATPASFSGSVAALLLVRGADFLSVFDKPQRYALAMLFLRLHHGGVVANEIFWGLWLFPFGL